MKHRSRTIQTALAAAAAGVVCCATAIPVRAVTGGSSITWNDATGDAIWGTVSNWSANAVPGAADSVVLPAPFPGPGAKSTISLSSGALAGDLTINGNYTVNSGTLALGSGTINSSAAPVINSQLIGSGGLLKLGSGSLTLMAANSYTGGTTLREGTLNFYSSANFGSGDLSLEGGTFHLINGGSITSNIALNTPAATIDTNGYNASCFGSVSGTGSLSKIGAGMLTLSGPISYTGATTVSAGTLRLSVSANQVIASPSVTLGANAKLVVLGATGTILKTPALSIGAGASIDLGLGKMLVPGGDVGSFSGSAYTGLSGLVQSGRNGNALPLWDGGGIVTSQFQATGGSYYSIGIARASDVRPATATATALWAGQAVSGNDVLVMCTYGGDANLDGKINVDDYIRIDSGIAAHLTGWSNGDFNYDGKVNIDDYTTAIDANIADQTGVFFTSPSAVPLPEASGLALVPIAWALHASRRGRRSFCN